MISEVIAEEGARRWTFFGRDQGHGEITDTNEYLVTHDGAGLLCDPGGIEVFPAVVAALSRQFDPNHLEALFGSHQDPDILSSLPLWVDLQPSIRVHTPTIWTGFIRHFAAEANIIGIPDDGGTIALGGSNDLTFVPAHYLHSSANFSLYDPRCRLLFSGDIGAALLPASETAVTVRNFDRHIGFMTGFHQRWMPSNRAKQVWIDRVSRLDIELLCPQHGAVFVGEDVARFLQWFSDLEVATAV